MLQRKYKLNITSVDDLEDLVNKMIRGSIASITSLNDEELHRINFFAKFELLTNNKSHTKKAYIVEYEGQILSSLDIDLALSKANAELCLMEREVPMCH